MKRLIFNGDLVKIKMRLANKSLDTLAKEIGVAKGTILAWCNNKFCPSFENEKKLCNALNMTKPELYLSDGVICSIEDEEKISVEKKKDYNIRRLLLKSLMDVTDLEKFLTEESIEKYKKDEIHSLITAIQSFNNEAILFLKKC